MADTIKKSDINAELPDKKKTEKSETYAGLHESTQTFSGIGMFEAIAGDVILRGRHGVRDHIYPLHRAIARYGETEGMIHAMAKHAIRGWDTLMDINKDFKGYILEAIKQRRSLNMPIGKEALEFERIHGDNKITV